jgi:hypothetical protein
VTLAAGISAFPGGMPKQVRYPYTPQRCSPGICANIGTIRRTKLVDPGVDPQARVSTAASLLLKEVAHALAIVISSLKRAASELNSVWVHPSSGVHICFARANGLAQ